MLHNMFESEKRLNYSGLNTTIFGIAVTEMTIIITRYARTARGRHLENKQSS